MNCQQALALKHAYADGEIDVIRALELEEHLGSCRACAQAYENLRLLKSSLKSDALYFKAPAKLKQQIRVSLRHQNGNRIRKPLLAWPWFRIAIPSMGVALIALALFALWRGPASEDRLAQEITFSHVRSLMASHLTDMASTDQHTVKPWFDGKLDFAPKVVDLAGRGFPLVGGRLDYLANRPVAALVYQRRLHYINLFIWPAPDTLDTRDKLTVRQGYNLVHWTQSGMTYWAVSDLNLTELLDFVHALR